MSGLRPSPAVLVALLALAAAVYSVVELAPPAILPPERPSPEEEALARRADGLRPIPASWPDVRRSGFPSWAAARAPVEPAPSTGPPASAGGSPLEGPAIEDARAPGSGPTDNDLPFEMSPGTLSREPLVLDGGDQQRSPVDQALEWLRNHQDEDGRWDGDGFMKHDKVSPLGDGGGDPASDTGVTGLALLAFLGAGQTHKHGAFKKTVREGLRHLKSIQDPEGCFGSRADPPFLLNHALAAVAMAEAYALTASPLYKQSAQSAVDLAERWRDPYLAWQYGLRPGDRDAPVSTWMTMALTSARAGGLRVDESSFAGVRRWFASGTPEARTETLTAMEMLCRVFGGDDPEADKWILDGAQSCLRRPPVAGSPDLTYWYFGTLALWQVGGDTWTQWSEALWKTVLDRQRTGPVSFRGS